MTVSECRKQNKKTRLGLKLRADIRPLAQRLCMYNKKSERSHYSLMKNANEKEFYTETALHYPTSFNL